MRITRATLFVALTGLSLTIACNGYDDGDGDSSNQTDVTTHAAVDHDDDGWTDGYDDQGNLVDGIVGPLYGHEYWDQHFLLIPFDAYVTDNSVWEDWPVVMFDRGNGPEALPTDNTYSYCTLQDGEWCHPYDEYFAVDTHEMGVGPVLIWLESGNEPGVNALDINDAYSASSDPLWWRTDHGAMACAILEGDGVHGKTEGACNGLEALDDD